jgi:hypothetical protein
MELFQDVTIQLKIMESVIENERKNTFQQLNDELENRLLFLFSKFIFLTFFQIISHFKPLKSSH